MGEDWLGQLARLCLVIMAGVSPFYILLGHFLLQAKIITFSSFFFFIFFYFLWPHLWHVEIPRLGVELEPQLLATATVIAMPDPSLVCSLHHNSWQCQILNQLSKARDRTYVLIDAS